MIPLESFIQSDSAYAVNQTDKYQKSKALTSTAFTSTASRSTAFEVSDSFTNDIFKIIYPE